MREARLNTETTDLLDQLQQAHQLQKQKIVDQFNDGLFLLTSQLTPLLINETGKLFLEDNWFSFCPFSQIQA